jgi:hypothetical protein
MDFSKQLIRSSAIGLIMTDGKAKGSGMGDTCKNYLKDLYREKKYGIRKEFTNKYVEKGLQVEERAIETYSLYKGGFYFKNDEWFKNEFISGTPDIVSDNVVIDIKSSWSLFTFPFAGDKLDKGYNYQLQSYMALTGLKEAVLAYVLVDTPIQIVEDEKRRLNWKMGLIDSENPDYLEACEEIEKSHSFGHIPISERIVEFEIKRDDETIEAIYKRVSECRTYLQSLDEA